MDTSRNLLPLRVICHNIRYATRHPGPGEQPWSVRRPLLAKQFLYHARHCPITLICLQEVLHEQLEDLLNDLTYGYLYSDKWAAIGVGRDDGRRAGEYCPILYRPSVWNVAEFRTIWLSETPGRPSKGWDAASIRLLTIGEFGHRETGIHITAMNTHLDDQGKTARQEAAKIIVREAEYSSFPVIVAGDMNSTEDDVAYQTLVDEDSGAELRDLQRMVEDIDPRLCYGFKDTWTGFDGVGGGEGLKRIDFIFHKWDSMTERGYAVLENKFDDGIFLSDHRAVVGDISIPILNENMSS